MTTNGKSGTANSDVNNEEDTPATRLPSISSSTIQVATVSIPLLFIFFAELVHPGGFQSALADFGFAGLAIVSLLFILQRGTRESNLEESLPRTPRATWRWTIFSLGLLGALSVQTWFVSGTALAGGDIAPPLGTAWIGKVFENFGWSGNNLGATVGNQTQLPWAIVEWFTHALGGSGALAQRIWYSLLVAAILMAAASLARALQLSPLGGAVIALVYFFNPETLSQIGDNTVFMVAMILVPALAAVSISYGTSRIKLWQLCLTFVIAAPFVGYAYSNPPLVLMIVFTTLTTPLLVWVRFGSEMALRSLRGTLIAGSLLAGASSFWLIPSLTSLTASSSNSLSPLSAWAFTEARTTLTNGLWLNSVWSWGSSIYTPYSMYFTRFPLALIPALVPMFAFLALLVPLLRRGLSIAATRLVGLLALLTLAVILLTTGTRSPGNLIFDPLYRLPYGWLLREPNRFLLVAALGFALLNGLLIEQFANGLRLPSFTRRFLRPDVTTVPSRILIAGAALVVALASSFPLWTGAIIPGPRQGFPSSHVKIPAYWNTMANYLNSTKAPKGNLLILPPDDFYQMPYTWYYGTDSFITNLMVRNVVVPSGQGYSPSTHELINAVQFEAQSIVKHDWKMAGRVLAAMNTPLVLVRGDIEPSFAGRSIVSPAELLAGLKNDPEMVLVRHDGPLAIYEIRAAFREESTHFATVNSPSPRIRDLALLPSRTALVTSPPLAGHEALFQLPSLSKWQLGVNSISTSIRVPAGRQYILTTGSSSNATKSKLSFSKSSRTDSAFARVQIATGTNLMANADFTSGVLPSVGNCNDALPVTKSDVLSATVAPNGGPRNSPAVELRASVDSACESEKVPWHKGPILLSLDHRSLNGAVPRICVWQVPSNSCAATSPLTPGSQWQHYTSAFTPLPGTTALSIYLYADALGNGTTSVDEYSDISARSLPFLSNLTLVGATGKATTVGRLETFTTGYSSQWIGPHGAAHVIVDGLRNGWIVGTNSKNSLAPRNSAIASDVSEEILFSLLAALFALALWWFSRAREA
jgi:hypothetical protein